MFETVYEWIVGLPKLVPIFLIFLGPSLLGMRKFPFSNDIQFSIGRPSLGAVGIVVGIVAGIVGIIVGVIQIGVFLGWWPEKLA